MHGEREDVCSLTPLEGLGDVCSPSPLMRPLRNHRDSRALPVIPAQAGIQRGGVSGDDRILTTFPLY